MGSGAESREWVNVCLLTEYMVLEQIISRALQECISNRAPYEGTQQNFLSEHVVGENGEEKGPSSTNTGLGPVDYVIQAHYSSSVSRDLCSPSVLPTVCCLSPAPPPHLDNLTFDHHACRRHSPILAPISPPDIRILSRVPKQIRWPQTGRSTSKIGHLITPLFRLGVAVTHPIPPPQLSVISISSTLSIE